VQIAGFHRFVSPAEFEISFSLGRENRQRYLKLHTKDFKFCAREKTKTSFVGHAG
jgi:hypothetical protein